MPGSVPKCVRTIPLGTHLQLACWRLPSAVCGSWFSVFRLSLRRHSTPCQILPRRRHEIHSACQLTLALGSCLQEWSVRFCKRTHQSCRRGGVAFVDHGQAICREINYQIVECIQLIQALALAPPLHLTGDCPPVVTDCCDDAAAKIWWSVLCNSS